ncbi:hypothetical protein [uncultured Alteromonas sp.]|uniref:hypothetical protein n=1 Tax=uncultured Alteromonas sp. TaxID=179113 RepID=UPI0030D99B26
MSSENIKILTSDSLAAVYHQDHSGQMATTYACRVRWDENTESKAFVKRFSNNDLLGICNEITGYLIAKASELPVPRYAGLINTKDGQFPQSSVPLYDWAFVVSNLPGNTPGSFYNLDDITRCKSLMNLVAGWNKVSDVIAFDDWVANEDRHLGNIMVTGRNNIHIFDHSNLPMELNWTASQLDVNYEAKSILLNNLFALGCTPLPVKSKVADATSNHKKYYDDIKEELDYWWNVLLAKDSGRRKALEEFIEKRAYLGANRVNSELRLLA